MLEGCGHISSKDVTEKKCILQSVLQRSTRSLVVDLENSETVLIVYKVKVDISSHPH